jgi:gamma-glutamylcyclotransferase
LSVLYFAYGSNMASAEMETWCPEGRFLGPARLDGHRLAFTRRSIRWGGGAADAVPGPGDEVWGALYETPEHALARLDGKEGEGFAYRRAEVEVVLGDERRRAVAYQVIDKEPLELPCNPEYASLLLQGGHERGLPEPYLRELEHRLRQRSHE